MAGKSADGIPGYELNTYDVFNRLVSVTNSKMEVPVFAPAPEQMPIKVCPICMKVKEKCKCKWVAIELLICPYCFDVIGLCGCYGEPKPFQYCPLCMGVVGGCGCYEGRTPLAICYSCKDITARCECYGINPPTKPPVDYTSMGVGVSAVSSSSGTDMIPNVAYYSYRPDGLRLSKTVNGVKTTHIWDGSNIVMELDASNNVVDIYIRGINLIKNNSSYYVFNAHGDVVQLTSSNGTVTKNYHYDAFGVETDKSETDSNPFRYCAEYFDKETGTIYLRARYYDPTTGRFSSEDPIRDGLNWYTYCNGKVNPPKSHTA